MPSIFYPSRTRGPRRHARSMIVFLRPTLRTLPTELYAPQFFPRRSGTFLFVLSYRAIRNGTPAAHGPKRHARSAVVFPGWPYALRLLKCVPSNFTPTVRELFFLILVRGRTWRALLPRGPKRLASSAPRSRARPETARPQHDTFSPAGPPPPAGRELLCISS